MDIFNTVGTLIGAAAKTEMMDSEGNVKNIKQAMMADALATSFGAVCGTSTVTTFVESGAGIAEGGRTGMTALSTAVLFILALFLSPLFLLIPSAATTGALVLVGVLMLSSIQDIDLMDISEALPSFITVLTMVLTYNIAEGMALGLISYTLVKLLSGQWRQVSNHPLHRLGTPHPALHPRYIIVERTPRAHNEEGPSLTTATGVREGSPYYLLRGYKPPFTKAFVSLRY